MAAGQCQGVVLFGRNVQDPHQLHSLCREAGRAHSGASAPFVCVDQEGGRVARLKDPHFTRFPPARSMAAPDDLSLLESLGRAMGEEMAAVGINLDFAPVMDVQKSADGVIGDRSFGADPTEAARRALAWLRGLEKTGVKGCVKHFPGHGDASCDSHVDLPTVQGDADATRIRHLPPFMQAVGEGVGAVMVGHLVVPHVDPGRPATLSAPLVTGILRREMGFDGVVITDDMEMGAITSRWGVGEAAVLAVEAGCDAILVCANRERQEEAVQALVREASRSEAFGHLVARSMARLERLARTLRRVPDALYADAIRSARHLSLARSAAG